MISLSIYIYKPNYSFYFICSFVYPAVITTKNLFFVRSPYKDVLCNRLAHFYNVMMSSSIPEGSALLIVSLRIKQIKLIYLILPRASQSLIIRMTELQINFRRMLPTRCVSSYSKRWRD
jgi:hypothetical protein